MQYCNVTMVRVKDTQTSFIKLPEKSISQILKNFTAERTERVAILFPWKPTVTCGTP